MRTSNEYQQNYLKYILRLPTNLILRELFDYVPKGNRETGRPPNSWKDQFVLPQDRNMLKGLNLAVDDDDEMMKLKNWTTTK
jgi:hypothetical protein